MNTHTLSQIDNEDKDAKISIQISTQTLSQIDNGHKDNKTSRQINTQIKKKHPS